MNNSLTAKKCIPCEKGTPPLSKNEIGTYLSRLENGWEVIDDKKIAFTFKCKTFADAIIFVNKVAEIAESENHHPNIHIYYNKVRISCATHAIGGLSENDFILAAKIEKVYPKA